MKKRAKDIPVGEEKKRPNAGTFIGTIIRSVAIVLGFILKVICKACTLLGLWIPIIYSLFGVALYLIFKFNPFAFDTLGTLYLCGGIACVIGSAIIAVRNLIVRPVKSIYNGYKHPLWEKAEDAKNIEKKEEESRWSRYKKEKETEKYLPPEVPQWERPVTKRTVDYGSFLAPLDDFDEVLKEERSEKISLDWLPKRNRKEAENVNIVAETPTEKPQVYFSALEPDILVHEYSDRFELYRVNGNRTTPVGVEYK